MDIDKLVMMVEQIERNIPPGPTVGHFIAAHLDSFWAPAMRKQLYTHVIAHREDFSYQIQAALDELHQQAKA